MVPIMFESIFKTELATLHAPPTMADQFWLEIQMHYTESDRYYHNLEHLNNMITQLQQVRNEVKNWSILIISVAYHDVIYDPSRPDNEERSAALAAERLMQLEMSPSQIEKCQQQILATKHHQPGDDPDLNFLIDADLSILGAEELSYTTYSTNIRNEYRHVPDHLYNAGRRKVLEHFLNRKHIYQTKYFRNKYESRARINISNELASMR